jgi:hypothetical protein
VRCFLLDALLLVLPASPLPAKACWSLWLMLLPLLVLSNTLLAGVPASLALTGSCCMGVGAPHCLLLLLLLLPATEAEAAARAPAVMRHPPDLKGVYA